MAAGLVCEVILADGGSVDETARLAAEVGAVFLPSPKGRGSQLRAGVDACKGAWALVLHADTVLPEGWSSAVQPLLGDPKRAHFFRLAFNSGGVMAKVTATWANIRSKWLGLPYGDQGLLISRALYDAVGGYADIPLMEDVAIARALRGHKFPAFQITATTGADRYLAQGWIRRGTRNLWMLMRYQLGAAPASLARRYQPARKSEEP
jgi:glycosyltransferase involved in cell wall biosynthesis